MTEFTDKYGYKLGDTPSLSEIVYMLVNSGLWKHTRNASSHKTSFDIMKVRQGHHKREPKTGKTKKNRKQPASRNWCQQLYC
jgi:hypothetical protein